MKKMAAKLTNEARDWLNEIERITQATGEGELDNAEAVKAVYCLAVAIDGVKAAIDMLKESREKSES